MKKPVIMAYAVNDALKTMTPEEANRLTHLNLAFGVLENGLLTMKKLPDIGRIETIRRWNPDIRIVLSIGGWGAGGFSIMARTAQTRAAFVESVRIAMDNYALDGVDIDWEYPCNDAAGIDADPSDRETFTLLLRELKAAVAPRTVSIAAGAGAYFVRDTEMDKVGEICDYVQLMTYDMCSASLMRTTHHTALRTSSKFPEGMSVEAAVRAFIAAGVPREKLVIGAAFYSRRWDGIADADHGLFQPTQEPAGFGPDYTTLAAEYIDKNGWTRYWDDEAQAAWLYKDGTFLTYDDPAAIRLKCAYIKQEGLYGIMYWEHHCDRTQTLLETIVEALWT